MKNNILIAIPTYNESDNVKNIDKEILKLNLPIDVLYIDDNSPDGTGEILKDIKCERRSNTKMEVIIREKKLGVGSAHKVAIEYAYTSGYNILITMDCDGTHDPKIIPMFLNKLAYPHNADVVIGTRHVSKTSLDGWSAWRKFVTHIGHALTSKLLNMPYDATGAFRAYNLNKLPVRVFNKVYSDDYSFFFESLTIIHENKFCIKEIPIKLSARSAGHSKLKLSDLVRSFIFMLKLKYRLTFDKKSIIWN
jgi:dolichol-phosphate mannosyltransferase